MSSVVLVLEDVKTAQDLFEEQKYEDAIPLLERSLKQADQISSQLNFVCVVTLVVSYVRTKNHLAAVGLGRTLTNLAPSSPSQLMIWGALSELFKSCYEFRDEENMEEVAGKAKGYLCFEEASRALSIASQLLSDEIKQPRPSKRIIDAVYDLLDAAIGFVQSDTEKNLYRVFATPFLIGSQRCAEALAILVEAKAFFLKHPSGNHLPTVLNFQIHLFSLLKATYEAFQCSEELVAEIKCRKLDPEFLEECKELILQARDAFFENKQGDCFPSLRMCSRCSKLGDDFLLCGNCKCLRYCSEVCQTHDWKRHKKECQELFEKKDRGKKNFCMCGKEGRFRCSSCLKEAYCSEECQKTDWKKHKLECRKK